MRALIPFAIAIPLLFSARSVWACDDDDNDSSDDDDVAEVEPPEAPEPPEPPDHWVAQVFAQPDIDVHWDIDVRWNDHGDEDRAEASQLVRDRIDELEQRLDDVKSALDDLDEND
jgi:hypothetical protein